MKKKLPRSLRKYIRKEKARIHREVSDIKKQEKLINELYKKFLREDFSRKDGNKETGRPASGNCVSLRQVF